MRRGMNSLGPLVNEAFALQVRDFYCSQQACDDRRRRLLFRL